MTSVKKNHVIFKKKVFFITFLKDFNLLSICAISRICFKKIILKIANSLKCFAHLWSFTFDFKLKASFIQEVN